MPNDKIPDDIMAAARGCAGRIHGLSMDVWETEKAVARAIAAERERCERAALIVADDYYKRAQAFDNLPPQNKGSANTEAHFGAMLIVGKIRSGK